MLQAGSCLLTVVVVMSHTPGAYRGVLRAKVAAMVLQAIDN